MRRPRRSPYVVLGVAIDATEGQVRAAFRGRAGEHPDKSAPESREAAAAAFAEVTEAYGILSDVTARGQYDRAEPPYERAEGETTTEGEVPDDFKRAFEFAKGVAPEVIDVLIAADTGEPIGARATRAAKNLTRGVVDRTKTPEGQAQLRSVAGILWRGLLGLERSPP